MRPFDELARRMVREKEEVLDGKRERDLSYPQRFGRLIVVEGVSGDESCMKVAIHHLLVKIMKREEALGQIDLDLILVAFSRAMNDARALRAMSGDPARIGAAKRGNASLRRATQVLHSLSVKGGSMENAWECVAESANTSSTTVKRDWMKWRTDLLRAFDLPANADAKQIRQSSMTPLEQS